MIITYYGKQCFKIQQGQTTLGINVYNTESAKSNGKPKPPRFRSDILLVSMNHSDFAPDGIADLDLHSPKDPFVVAGPGEYEIKDIVIKGFQTESGYQGRQYNSFYLIEIEGMKVAVLGALANKDLPIEVKEVAPDSDIWITPIGGSEVLEAEEAYKLAVKMEPAVIIPCHYDNGNGDSLQHFLKSGGLEKAKPQEKLTIKKKDLAGQTGEIVVLDPQ